eukprot:scaffold34836_cov31-Tisochrysis_lutea.AAC.1
MDMSRKATQITREEVGYFSPSRSCEAAAASYKHADDCSRWSQSVNVSLFLPQVSPGFLYALAPADGCHQGHPHRFPLPRQSLPRRQPQMPRRAAHVEPASARGVLSSSVSLPPSSAPPPPAASASRGGSSPVVAQRGAHTRRRRASSRPPNPPSCRRARRWG